MHLPFSSDQQKRYDSSSSVTFPPVSPLQTDRQYDPHQAHRSSKPPKDSYLVEQVFSPHHFPPAVSLTWRAVLSTRTCGWPASPTASAPSPPGPSKSTNAAQETRTSSALWTCRWETTSLWLQPLFFEALLCVGLAFKAEAHGNDSFDFLSINAGGVAEGRRCSRRPCVLWNINDPY